MGNHKKVERNRIMHTSFLKRTLLASSLAIASAWAQDDDVKALPLSMVTQVDAGQVVKGQVNQDKVEQKFLQRTSVWITQELAIGQRLNVRAGVGGLFWYTFPGGDPGYSSVAPFTTGTKFGPGITRADMEYKFGDVENPMFTVQAGFFPYKYNPDAKNLGEYLLRSGTYPGTLTTGGWNIMSEAAYMMQGVRLNMSLWNGKFQSEFLLPMERDLPPNGDLSPTYIGTVRPIPGVEIGAGVACNHCLAVKPSKASPEKKYNSNNASNDGYGNAYVIKNPNYNPALPVEPISSLESNPNANSEYKYDTTQFYTFVGVKLMARASFDPKAFVPMPMLGPSDLKIFGEIALLGVENYPFYYEKRTERMPVMFGINLPTFRLLDLLSFQMEYYNSKFPNSLENAYKYSVPTVVGVNSAGTFTNDPNQMDQSTDLVAKDNWKWSVYAKKEVVSGIRLYAQIANDHLRVPGNFDGVNSWIPITPVQGRDWYYLVRFEFGI
jgi:hypothetical protein